ncbi:MAG: uracil-DNA glycosylase family protein, partial [Anaerovoracaceae bacterium]|nr:uracil-DNA glycosylase family protein [Anaerovoracaceae bacterium]
VLLLNSVLTVRANQARSHHGLGWEEFTTDVIKLLDLREKPMVFILWGSPAQRKQSLITNPAHLVLKGRHPSPLSAYKGFFGGKYFTKTNEFLDEPVDWRITD